jgi:hypothetical protein
MPSSSCHRNLLMRDSLNRVRGSPASWELLTRRRIGYTCLVSLALAKEKEQIRTDLTDANAASSQPTATPLQRFLA